jgi:acetyltransferase-like isoleucine patch superfamily enzyme
VKNTQLAFYIQGQAKSWRAYLAQEAMLAAFGWIPSVVGIAARSVAYRAILRMRGSVAIEHGVRLRHTHNITLGNGVYLDYGTYLHATPGGIAIGDGTFVMHGALLHVYNFRALPHAFIRIGANCIVGEGTVIRGQGGVTIGDHVLIAPNVQILAVEHTYGLVGVPVMHQGIRATGITIGDGAWLGAGCVILDGVTVGEGAVIGAGAVVTKDVPSHAVALGVPARIVRDYAAAPPHDQSIAVELPRVFALSNGGRRSRGAVANGTKGGGRS